MNVLGLDELTSVDRVFPTTASLFADVPSDVRNVPLQQSTRWAFKVGLHQLLSGLALTMATVSLNSLVWSDARILFHNYRQKPPPAEFFEVDTHVEAVRALPEFNVLPELNEEQLEKSWRSALTVLATAGADVPQLIADAGERLDAWRRTPLALTHSTIQGDDDRT